jgi:signal transduction histidine kinase
VIDLDHKQPQRNLARFVSYIELPGTAAETLSEALALPSSAFAPIDTRYIDPGATSNALWLLLSVRNPSGTDGIWLLSLNVRFLNEIIASRRDETGVRAILDLRESSTFTERPRPERLLAVPLDVAAGQTAELLIGYRSTGTTALPLSIETPASFDERYAREDALNIACYAAVGVLALLSVLQALTFGQSSQLNFALYLGAALLYIAHMDGITFQYLWPDSPVWNSYASVPLRLAMSATALWFTRSFVQPKKLSPALDRVMLGLIGVAALLSAGWFFVTESQLKTLAYLVASLSAGICCGAALLAQVRGQSAMRFFTLGWIGVFVGLSLTTIANNFPSLIVLTTADAAPKYTIMFNALTFYMALADRARVWRLERDAAMRGEIEALHERRKVTDELHAAERARLEALLLAQTKTRQLAMASHDIRQPLASLRLTVERLAKERGAEGELADGLIQSVEYLQRLTDIYSGLPIRDTTSSEGKQSSRPEDIDSFPIATVLDNVELMFRDEAVAKGLALRSRKCRAEVRGDAMIAMRLVSNLVANAVKYTEHGKILLGCRRHHAKLRVVVADTGPGIEADELARVMHLQERGRAAGDVEGHGLGLGIANALAQSGGYKLSCRSIPGKGTAFFVEFELANAT